MFSLVAYCKLNLVRIIGHMIYLFLNEKERKH